MIARKTLTRWLFFAALSMLIALIAPAASSAFGIVPGSVQFRAVNGEGNPDTRAGAHPDRLFVSFELETTGTALRELAFEFGPGFTGAPFAAPVCSRAVFEDEGCPADTQVGVFKLNFTSGQEPLAIYNVAPAGNEIAAFGFQPLWQTELETTLRASDLGLNMLARDMAQLPIVGGEVELWGVPADHVAAPERAAFFTTPTECTPLHVVVRARSWEVGAPWVSGAGESDPFTGCEGLSFEPHLGMQLSNPVADSPTGTQIDIGMAAHNGPDEQTGASLKKVEVHLPHGMALSAGAAESVEPCSDAQFGLGTESPVTCPSRSRVGTVEISTPQLEEVLTGTLFLGEERPGERLRLFVDAVAPGIPFKALGQLAADPDTGALTAVLSDLPQVSFSRISLNLDGSQPLLTTPLSCGPASASATFTAYGPHEPVNRSTVVNVQARPGSGCPAAPGFSPKLIAGSTEPGAGANTSFSLTFTRQDGEQLPKRITHTLPEGLDANLAIIDICRGSDIEADTCPASSRIGSAMAEVGSGLSPGIVRGGVYLTEGYKNAPFGLLIVFEATVGPFHLGSIDVRGALRLDPRTGQLTFETDPLPLIFEGLALRFRTIGIDLEGPGFLRNPTSCDAEQVSSTVTAVDGKSATIIDPFQVNGCEKLGFRPRFGLALDSSGGKHQSNPKLSISVRTREGDANLSQFKVKFPSLLAFHSRGVKAICARGDAREGLCPAASRVGTGVAHAPLLNEPLQGPVYLVQPQGGGFPDFWSDLEGMGVKIQLVAESSQQGNHLVTEMSDLPDVPLSTFTMNLNGGKGGLFSFNGNPCGRNRGLTSPVSLLAQDGAGRRMQVPFKTSCARSHRKRIVGRQAPDRRR